MARATQAERDAKQREMDMLYGRREDRDQRYSAPRTRVLFTSKGERVETTLTDREAAKAIGDAFVAGRDVTEFAKDLARAAYSARGCSERQRPWLHKIALELSAPAQPTQATPQEPAQPALNLLPLVAMLQRAAKTLQKPRVTVVFPGYASHPEVKLQLGICGPRSRTPGALNVTDGGAYGDDTWFGRITTEGAWQPSPRPTGTPAHVVAAALQLWAADPVGIAKQHGQRSGSCCFCRRHLETRESLAVGYGPVCADKFGLPWGGKVATAVEQAAEEAALAAQDAEAA